MKCMECIGRNADEEDEENEEQCDELDKDAMNEFREFCKKFVQVKSESESDFLFIYKVTEGKMGNDSS